MIKTFEIGCAGYSIIADWYEGQNTDKILLILQGFTSSRPRQANFTNSVVNATGSSALVIDYTGHGDSPFELKDTQPAQHVAEVIRAFDWIKENYPQASIQVIGNSYGSFLASHLSLYREFETLILRAPAIYRPESLYDLWSKRFDDEDAYRETITSYRNDPDELKKSPLFANRALKIPKNVLVVVHEHDEVIPRDTSNVYIEEFGASSFVAKGFNHALSQSDVTQDQVTDYYERISNWLKSF